MVGSAISWSTINLINNLNSQKGFDVEKIRIVKAEVMRNLKNNIKNDELTKLVEQKFNNANLIRKVEKILRKIVYPKVLKIMEEKNSGYNLILQKEKLKKTINVQINILNSSKKECEIVDNTLKSKIDMITLAYETKMTAVINNNEQLFLKDKKGNFIKNNNKYVINPNSYDWTKCNIYYDYAKKNNLKIHGHAIIDAVPEILKFELKDRNVAQKREMCLDFIEDYLINFLKNAKQYNIEMPYLDLFNEIADNWESRKVEEMGETVAVRNSFFKKAMGKNYYIDILKMANKVKKEQGCNNCKLVYNEFGEYDPTKRKKINIILNNIVQEEKKCGQILLDTIGLQSHLNGLEKKEEIEKTFSELSKYGKELFVSEIDCVADPKKFKFLSKKKKAKLQGKSIAQVLEIAKRYGVESVSTWDISDSFGWRVAENACPINNQGQIQAWAKDMYDTWSNK